MSEQIDGALGVTLGLLRILSMAIMVVSEYELKFRIGLAVLRSQPMCG